MSTNKINEFYVFAEEVSNIFKVVVDEYKKLADAYVNETIKLKIWKDYSDVGQKMYFEKCDELDKVLEKKEQAEYDRDYYEKYSKELLCEINRE